MWVTEENIFVFFNNLLGLCLKLSKIKWTDHVARMRYLRKLFKVFARQL
jgi:hypothetical protein